MGKQVISDRPFQRLYIECLSPCMRSNFSKRFIFLALNQASKFLLIKTMPKATAKEVSKFFKEWVYHICKVPKYINSDNGVQFCLKILVSLWKKCDMKRVTTAFYSPQANVWRESINLESNRAVGKTSYHLQHFQSWVRFIQQPV